MNFINIFSVVISAIFVFLFIIKKFSGQIHRVEGDRFKRVLETMTKTPTRGVVAGTVLTGVIQSSTAVTLMLLGLVDAGALPFFNSLGVIFGANIGTTITSQIVAFKILYLAPFIVVAGFLMEKFDNKYQKYSKMIFYFGMILWCLLVINMAVEPLKTEPLIIDLFSRIDGLFVAIIVGLVSSVIIQSSSVVSGMVVLIVAQNLLSFEQGFGIILGSNIGTTSTTLIASLVMGVMARRTAIAHLFFNFLGVILFIPFVEPFSSFINSINIGADKKVALSHAIFNITFAILFVVFIKPFHQIVIKISKFFETE